MAAPKIQIAPELVIEGKRLYEQTLTPVKEIAAMMGVSRWTLESRIREWEWKRRRHPTGPVDLLRAVRGAAVAAVTAPGLPEATIVPVTPERRAALAARIMDVVERQMDAIERVLATVQPNDPGEGERGMRMLASITQTLREIAALNKPDEVTPDEADADAIPDDMDELRYELARRLSALIDARCERESGGVRGTADGVAAATD